MNYLWKSSSRDKSIFLANMLDHFDTAIYSLLAPFLAPIFFPEQDTVIQLLLAYSVLASAVVTRPLGALFFGLFAQNRGIQRGLCFSLYGLGLCCLLISLLPTYVHWGWASGALLFVLRGGIGFFAAGEGSLAPVLILLDKPPEENYETTYWYQTSSMIGTVSASVVCTAILCVQDTYPDAWRLCFLGGSAVSLAAYRLRNTPEILLNTPLIQKRARATIITAFHQLWEHRFSAFSITLLSGFSYITYAFPFIFLNGFVPLITSITLKELLEMNSLLLMLDMLLIPVVGRVLKPFFNKRTSQPYGAHRNIMLLSLSLLVLFVPLMMGQLDFSSTLAKVTFLRIGVILLGVIFLTPKMSYTIHLFEKKEAAPLVIGLASSLGSSLIGRTLPAVCMALWIYKPHPLVPATYVVFWALMGILVIILEIRNREQYPIFKNRSLHNSNPEII
ncbi:MAG: MFS transporter [Chlamydiia bacterium]